MSSQNPYLFPQAFRVYPGFTRILGKTDAATGSDTGPSSSTDGGSEFWIPCSRATGEHNSTLSNNRHVNRECAKRTVRRHSVKHLGGTDCLHTALMIGHPCCGSPV